VKTYQWYGSSDIKMFVDEDSKERRLSWPFRSGRHPSKCDAMTLKMAVFFGDFTQKFRALPIRFCYYYKGAPRAVYLKAYEKF
jgi:hypothetical protein